MTITNPPSLEDAPRIFGDAQTLEERRERLICRVFGFYERGEPYMKVGAKERQLPAVREWEARMRVTREGLGCEALFPVKPGEGTVWTVSAPRLPRLRIVPTTWRHEGGAHRDPKGHDAVLDQRDKEWSVNRKRKVNVDQPGQRLA